MKTLIGVVLLLGLSAPVFAQEPVIPENFFRAFPEPNGKISFGYTMPSLNEPKQAANTLWWNAVAKFRWLQYNDPDFLAVYRATKNDPGLQTTGVNFQEWSSGSPEQKEAARKALQERANEVVKKHGLQLLLETSYVEDKAIEQVSAELRGAPTVELPLVRYCPGATKNISINPRHPEFARYQRMLEVPETSGKYYSAVEEFGKYLASNPKASIDDRNAELDKLVRPILSQVR